MFWKIQLKCCRIGTKPFKTHQLFPFLMDFSGVLAIFFENTLFFGPPCTYLPKASTDCPFTDLMGRSVTIANNNPGPVCHDTDQWQWHIIIIMSDLSPVTSVGCRARAEPSSTGRRPTPPASRTTPPPPATRRTTMTTRRRTATTRTSMDSTEIPSD